MAYVAFFLLQDEKKKKDKKNNLLFSKPDCLKVVQLSGQRWYIPVIWTNTIDVWIKMSCWQTTTAVDMLLLFNWGSKVTSQQGTRSGNRKGRRRLVSSLITSSCQRLTHWQFFLFLMLLLFWLIFLISYFFFSSLCSNVLILSLYSIIQWTNLMYCS